MFESHLSVYNRGERVSIVLLEMIFCRLVDAADAAVATVSRFDPDIDTSGRCYNCCKFLFCFVVFGFLLRFCSALFRSYNAVNIF